MLGRGAASVGAMMPFLQQLAHALEPRNVLEHAVDDLRDAPEHRRFGVVERRAGAVFLHQIVGQDRVADAR